MQDRSRLISFSRSWGKKFDIDIKERKIKGHGALVDYLLSEVFKLLGGKQPNLNLYKESKNELIETEKKENKSFFRKKLKPILNDKI